MSKGLAIVAIALSLIGNPEKGNVIADYIISMEDDAYEVVLEEAEIVALAKMAWGEARGCTDVEIAATMWCVLNRVDAWGDEIVETVTAPYQFVGYRDSNPVEEHLYDLAVDVLPRWQIEKQGATAEEVGRVLPPQYLFFHGDGKHNYFRDAYRNGNVWDWGLPNPYI